VNSAVTSANPPSPRRLKLWMNARITVRGRPDWLFVKLHCHRMDPRDTPTLIGQPLEDFLRYLVALQDRAEFQVHFVTVREMTNIALADCEGKRGNPSEFRDYRLRLFCSHS
jgi:hypothetical protein